MIRGAGAVPSFLGYHGYPASICSSVNDRVMHGIPSADEVLALGDLVSIDCGAILDGWRRCRGHLGIGPLIDADEAPVRGDQAFPSSVESRPWCRVTASPMCPMRSSKALELRNGRTAGIFGIVSGWLAVTG